MSALLKPPAPMARQYEASTPVLTLVERAKTLLAPETQEWSSAQVALLVETMAVADASLRQRIETLLLGLGSTADAALMHGLLNATTRSGCASVLIRRGPQIRPQLSAFVAQHLSATPELGWVLSFMTQMWGA